MYVRVLSRQTLQQIGTTVAACTAIALLLQYPEAVHNGINRGLSICSTVIIPTLFPFMLLAGWLSDSALCRSPGQWMQAATRRIFGLPGCCAPAILLSLVGGYPAGMIAISRLYRQGQIQRHELRHLTAFCICGGPGFIVGTVGIGLMESVQAGWLLYIAQAVTAIGIGVGVGYRHRHSTPPTVLTPPKQPFAQTVTDTCRALLSMCGFVAAAAMLLSLLDGMGVSQSIAAHLRCSATEIGAVVAGLLEVSCGCVAFAGIPMAPLWLSACLGWGGLSIHGQLAAILPEERIVDRWFLGWRLVQAIASGGLALGLFYLFPPKKSVGSLHLSTLPFSVSSSATCMLLLLCFLTMLCFSEKKTGKSQ